MSFLTLEMEPTWFRSLKFAAQWLGANLGKLDFIRKETMKECASWRIGVRTFERCNIKMGGGKVAHDEAGSCVSMPRKPIPRANSSTPDFAPCRVYSRGEDQVQKKLMVIGKSRNPRSVSPWPD